MHSLRIAGWLMVQHVKARLAYRGDFYAETAATLLGAAFSLGFVWLLFENPLVGNIHGWTRDQVIFIYGFSLVPYGLFNLVSWNLYDFGDRYVIEGHLDRVLLRPVAAPLQVLCESFRLPSLAEAGAGVLMAAYASRRLGLVWTAPDVLAFGVHAVAGALILVGVFMTLACVNFWAEDRLGIAPPVFNMITFGRYPLTIYRPWLRWILSWVIPFGFLGFYPATGFLLRGEAFAPFRAYWYATPLVAAACLAVSTVVWRAGLRRYTSTGS